MATKREFLDFVLDQLSEVEGISHKQMMGEYILYQHEKIAAYLCDNRLMIKPVPAAEAMMPHAAREAPYEGAKDMLRCDDLENKQFLKELFEAIYPQLPEPKPRKKHKV